MITSAVRNNAVSGCGRRRVIRRLVDLRSWQSHVASALVGGGLRRFEYGIDLEKLRWVMDLKNVRHGRIRE